MTYFCLVPQKFLKKESYLTKNLQEVSELFERAHFILHKINPSFDYDHDKS